MVCAEEAGSKTKTSRLFVFSSEAMARRADTTALTVSLQEEHLPVVMVTSRLVLPIAMTWTEKSACIANLPRSHKHTCVLPADAIVLLYCGWLCCYTTTTYCCLRSLALVTCHPRAARIVTKKRKNGGKTTKSKESKERREGSPTNIFFVGNYGLRGAETGVYAEHVLRKGEI